MITAGAKNFANAEAAAGKTAVDDAEPAFTALLSIPREVVILLMADLRAMSKLAFEKLSCENI